jgi:hypothetical protein
MSEAVPGTQGGTSNGATAPATGSGAQPYDKSNFEARLRNEPEFAVAEVKKQQSYISELQQKTRDYEGRFLSMKPLVSAAELVGNGNLETGAQQLVSLADRGYRIENDPKAKAWYESYVSGGKIPDTQTDEYLTPEQQEIRELRQTIVSFEKRFDKTAGETAVMKMAGHIESFFTSDELGRAIPEGERPAMFKAMQAQFEQWSKTEAGRQQLGTLDAESVRLIATNHLLRSGKLYEVADRARALKEGAVYEEPGVPAISRMATEEVPEFSGPKAALQAMQYAAKKFGVKL